MNNQHNAEALRAELFATIRGVRAGTISPAQANAVSGVAREIIEIDKTAIAYMDKIGGIVELGLIEDSKNKPKTIAATAAAKPALGFARA